MKYLYVEMIDNGTPLAAYDYLGDKSKVYSTSRVVKIPLTEEQIKLLTPRKVACKSGIDIFEDVRIICVQEEKIFQRSEEENDSDNNQAKLHLKLT